MTDFYTVPENVIGKGAMRWFIGDVVGEGDRVVDIATGYGMLATLAAVEGATVHTYEAAAEMLDVAERTFEANGVTDRITTHHAIIGEVLDTNGPTDGAAAVPASDLPECDVLVLDCEGAELSILDSMDIRPEHVIVETHPHVKVGTPQVLDLLVSKGYLLAEHTKMGRRDKHALLGLYVDT